MPVKCILSVSTNNLNNYLFLKVQFEKCKNKQWTLWWFRQAKLWRKQFHFHDWVIPSITIKKQGNKFWLQYFFTFAFGWTIDRINVAKQVKPACKLQVLFCVTLKYFFFLQNTLLLFFQEVLSLYFFLLSPFSILWKKGWVAKAVSAFSSPSLFCMFPHKTQVLKSKVLTSKSAM